VTELTTAEREELEALAARNDADGWLLIGGCHWFGSAHLSYERLSALGYVDVRDKLDICSNPPKWMSVSMEE